jgi:outer membrane protein assembly factor BamB
VTRSLAALGLAVALAGATAAADFESEKYQNWHHWRGPDANGTAPKADPPKKWDATTNVRWKVPLPGRGSSTPIVWGDRVFVMAAVQTREAKADELPKPDPRFQLTPKPPTHFYKFLVLCLDRGTGKVLWERVAAERVPHEGHHPSHTYAAGSPTTDGQRLYACFGSFGTYCYDLDGKPLWSRDLGILHTRLGWGEAVTPVVHAGRVLLNFDQEADSALYCLDAATGETKWVAKRDDKTSWNTPLIAEHGGKTQVILNGTARIRSHDLATGDVIWSCGGMTVNAIPSAVKYGDNAIVMSGYKGAAAVSVPLSAKGDLGTGGGLNWRTAPGTPYVASPLLMGDRLYFTEGLSALYTVLDAKTGKPLIDKERLPKANSFYASPLGAAGRIYLMDRTGTALVLKAGDTFEVLEVNKLPEEIDASPVAVGKQLFLRGHEHLYCIEEK